MKKLALSLLLIMPYTNIQAGEFTTEVKKLNDLRVVSLLKCVGAGALGIFSTLYALEHAGLQGNDDGLWQAIPNTFETKANFKKTAKLATVTGGMGYTAWCLFKYAVKCGQHAFSGKSAQ